MTDDTITIEINGKPLQGRKGQMIIEVADNADIYIPRFCFHKKLSIAANCRMCLVEVEKMPKPAPACATPVMDGMKIFTRSSSAREAQKGVMEFLLINHPLDCPICDQGGECELQDLAMGYGRDVSRYTENKRVVVDEDIGPLVSTDMTRCIHCTRCVRFGEEIAGLPELGATGRGETMRIGTYVKKAMVSELSGNVIDLCPVGALNNKPYRFDARAWELMQHAGVSPHDCVGSNLFLHSLRNTVRRAVPRDNEVINEAWLSDRDRYSCHAINSDDRIQQPQLKVNGVWSTVSWDDALRALKSQLKTTIDSYGADALGVLTTANNSVEEYYLLQKWLRGVGGNHIDFRLRQFDFSADVQMPVIPWLGMDIAELETVDAVLLIGSNTRKEQPLAAHRLRKAALKGAALSFINTRSYDFNFPVAQSISIAPQLMVTQLAGVAKALCEQTGKAMPLSMESRLSAITVTASHQAIAKDLVNGKTSAVLLGSQASMLPAYAEVQALAFAIAELSDSRLGYFSDGANAAGACLAGALPHRGPAGQALATVGLNAREMLSQPRRGYILFNVEPEFDAWDAALLKQALTSAETVVAINSFDSPVLREHATIILPLAAFGETSGTYVNAEGRWQSVAGAVSPMSEARPGWKLLRVLGNLFDVPGFDYFSSEEVCRELQQQCADIKLDNRLTIAPTNFKTNKAQESAAGITRISDVPAYRGDALVRRSMPLQETQDAIQTQYVLLNAATANKLRLNVLSKMSVKQNEGDQGFPFQIDASIPDNCIYIALAIPGSEKLGPAFGTLEVMVS